MLSALVFASDARVPVAASPEAMVRTIAALVPAVVEGVVRDLTLAVHGPSDAAAHIADHAGCLLAVAASPAEVIAAGLALARGDTLLILRAGLVPGQGFLEEAADLAARNFAEPALLRIEPDVFFARLFPDRSRIGGVIASRRLVGAGAPHLDSLARRLGRPATLRTRLRPVG